MIPRQRYFIGLFLMLGWCAPWTWASPVSPDQALHVVQGWLMRDPQPLDTSLGPYVLNVEPHYDMNNVTLFYVVNLSPSGYVIVGAEGRVEPIIAFSEYNAFNPSMTHPLGALVTSDLHERMTHLHETSHPSSRTMLLSVPKTETATQRKWRQLTDLTSSRSGRSLLLSAKPGQSHIPDIRVAPLVQTKWGQGYVNQQLRCYNYYTPSHLPCGCAATAMAQLMYFYQYPRHGIGRYAFQIKVYDQQRTAYIIGGNGIGGPYDWDNMVLSPNSVTSETSRRAIGALCYDAGISINMEYDSDGSGADGMIMADALKQTFGYKQAITGYNNDDNISPHQNLLNMINPNMDAGYPVILGIYGGQSGHAVIADGYGYNESTMYHHLNMGYEGYSDIWYNLPLVNAYNEVILCIYNIFVQDRGEIISGRILGPRQEPLTGALVTAYSDRGNTFEATTNEKGIYALSHVPSLTSYDLCISKPGFICKETRVHVYYSHNDHSFTGNRWGIDFRAYLTGDYDRDDDVDLFDFAMFARHWRHAEDVTQLGTATGDISDIQDGIVNYADLLSFSENWLIGTEAPAVE